jgi:uncharacterized protein (TIGR02284 family)
VDNHDVDAILYKLIETCKDGKEGFTTAAEAVDDADLKQLFRQYSQERAAFIAELQMAVRREGGDPEATGSVAGALHRGWITFRSAMAGPDAAPVLAAAESGEDSATRAYAEALRADVPADIRALISRQSASVAGVHDTVRMLRERRRAA